MSTRREIAPTRVEMPLGGSPPLEYGFSVDAGTLTFDLDATYIFERVQGNKKYRAVGCRVVHWDAATGRAIFQPELVLVEKNDVSTN